MAHARSSPRRRRPRRLGPLEALLSGTALAVTGILLLGERNEEGVVSSTVLLEVAGDADQTTEPFAAEPGWQFQWEASVGEFSVGVGDEEGFDVVVQAEDGGNGVVAPDVNGTLRLAVAAEGPWIIKVLQGKRLS